jgi:hypothetical protein
MTIIPGRPEGVNPESVSAHQMTDSEFRLRVTRAAPE